MDAAPLPVKKLRVLNVRNAGESGKFCGNAESMGWMRDDGERMVVHPVSCVRKAEWFKGQLRVLCETEEDGSGTAVVAVDGFAGEDFDSVWRYFEQSCGIHVKKHRQIAALDAGDFDRAMRGIEDAADRVDEAAQGSPQKKGRELDLLKKVENVRDGLDEAVSGDKQALSGVFSANGCERIGRLRLVLDTVLLEVYSQDPRWLHLRNMCSTIEAVLKDLGTFRQWRPSEDTEHASLLRRLMVRELKRAQGQTDAEPEKASPKTLAEAEAGPRPLNADRLAGAFPVYGAAHPHYGALPREEPAPQPDPAEAEAVARAAAEAEAAAAAAAVATAARAQAAAQEPGGDGRGDREVTDPNLVRAGSPDGKRGAAQGGDLLPLRTHPGSILEGWVWKRSRYLRRWRRRWLVLMPQTLMSFTARASTSPTESIAQSTVSAVYGADAEVFQSRSFAVALSRRTHYMVCDDEKQKEAWIKEISTALVRGRR